MKRLDQKLSRLITSTWIVYMLHSVVFNINENHLVRFQKALDPNLKKQNQSLSTRRESSAKLISRPVNHVTILGRYTLKFG